MKKLLYLIFLLPALTFGQQLTINIGVTANDGTGDNLRAAFTKVNTNFTELYTNVVGSGTASGTDTYLLSADPTAASYYTGQKFSVIFTNANTGAATININNLGAKALKKNVSSDLESGDIDAGSAHVIIYDGTNFQVLTLGGSSGVWGTITGTLSSQTDLQSALDAKIATTRTISTTSPLSGGGDLSANRTLTISDAAADGSTKGAASFTANDFNATSGNISIDYTNGQAASGSNKGFLTSSDWTTFNANSVTSSNSSTSGNITLDLNSKAQSCLNGSATFSTPKTIALSNTTNAITFVFTFEVTNIAATLTVPSDWYFNSPDYNTSVWTPPATGKYFLSGKYDSVLAVWFINVNGPYTH